MDRDYRDNEEEEQVDGYGSLVHRAAGAGKEYVHKDRESDGANVHAEGAAKEDPAPDLRVGFFDLFEAGLGPGVCEVDEKDEAEEQEEHGADQSKVVAPDEEETLGDKESGDDQEQPGDDLWSPVPVLNSGTAVTSVIDAEEDDGENGMEDPKRKLDAVDGDKAVALLTETRYGEVVESQVLELLDRPRRKHDPRKDAVDKENQGVRDPRGSADGHVNLALKRAAVWARETYLLLHFPQALQSAEHAAAPQHDRAKDPTV